VSNIRLTRTQNLTDGKKITIETKATVKVEGEKGGSQTFVDKGDGTYTLADGGLQFGQKYRLSIKTLAGRSYQSDYVIIKKTPKIDEVSWKIVQNDGVQFYVSAHDETNSTKYYRWEYEETWEFYSGFYSRVDYQKKAFVTRLEDINHCWGSGKSTGIYIGSTTQLTQDIINKSPLLFVSNSASNRLKYRYSLLVKQYAQTAESFEYWQNLKKNTESLGSIFDPQPFQVIGNFHGVTDPDEPVVGFLSGYSVEEKRIFVNSTELPEAWHVPSMYESCLPDTAPVIATREKQSAAQRADAGAIPIDEIFSPFGAIVAYRLSSPFCVDCRTSGSNVKPSFW
jgi:hypothetical protein